MDDNRLKVTWYLVLSTALAVGSVHAQTAPDPSSATTRPSIERNQVRLTGKSVARGSQMRSAFIRISALNGGLADADRQVVQSLSAKGPNLSKSAKTLREDLCAELKRQEAAGAPDSLVLAEYAARGEREEYEALAVYYEQLVGSLSNASQQAFDRAMSDINDASLHSVGTDWVGLAVEDPDFLFDRFRNSCNRKSDSGPTRNPIQVIHPDDLSR